MVAFATTIFLSALLLFQVQPMLAKFILPWFGGSAAVWSAALLFFQLLLLGGYLYAHCLIRYFQPKAQFGVHGALLIASFAALPIMPAAHWKPVAAGDPTMRILLLLTATVGLPYMLLSATSPLLQAWYVRMHAGAIPYRWFALSNFGSLLGLLSYPVLVEPKLTLGAQARAWSVAYAVFAITCGVTAWKSRSGIDPTRAGASDDAPAPRAGTIVLWIALAACASTLLLAVTSHLTQNLVPIPLLWVAPLSLYLLSFILCFESDRIYNRIVFLPLLAGSLGLLAYADFLYENNAELKRFIPALCGALFVCCMFCHGELARSKPHPRYLTLFYLMISAGGAAGGLFVALAAPRWFNDYWELPIAMAGCAALVTCVLWNVSRTLVPSNATRGRVPVNATRGRVPVNATRGRVPVNATRGRVPVNATRGRVAGRAAMAAAAVIFAIYLGRAEMKKEREYTLSARNFYGVLRVRDDPAKKYYSARRVLIHGTINHGTQLRRPGSERIATSYFGRNSGVARAIRAKGETGPLRIGVLGLGAGVTAALARSGDTLHYYEINPLVVEIANREFGFLRACPASKEIFMGDGRLVLEDLPEEELDVLVLDAFSSDSIPVHLLTREAFAIYQRHLKRDAAIAIHISNRFLDLEPVVAQAAAEIDWRAMTVSDDGSDEDYYSPSTWVVMSRSPEIFNRADFQDESVDAVRGRANFRPWTDDYSNIIQILK